MVDSIEEIKARVPYLVLVQSYQTHADHTSDTFWYSRVTACDLEYYSLKFNPEYWRGTFVVGLNKNSQQLEFLSVNILKELKSTTADLIQTVVGNLYTITTTRGNQASYDVFLSPKSTVGVDGE
ncbi:MAG: hypothetical protein E6R04_02125 [Spirochaetes bacterium]|nr:MAG: hypothetical protein E6R04_02125 [Spirochaetota bacterium]